MVHFVGYNKNKWDLKGLKIKQILHTCAIITEI
jgi:hypothetical protein